MDDEFLIDPQDGTSTEPTVVNLTSEDIPGNVPINELPSLTPSEAETVDEAYVPVVIHSGGTLKTKKTTLQMFSQVVTHDVQPDLSGYNVIEIPEAVFSFTTATPHATILAALGNSTTFIADVIAAVNTGDALPFVVSGAAVYPVAVKINSMSSISVSRTTASGICTCTVQYTDGTYSANTIFEAFEGAGAEIVVGLETAKTKEDIYAIFGVASWTELRNKLSAQTKPVFNLVTGGSSTKLNMTPVTIDYSVMSSILHYVEIFVPSAGYQKCGRRFLLAGTSSSCNRTEVHDINYARENIHTARIPIGKMAYTGLLQHIASNMDPVYCYDPTQINVCFYATKGFARIHPVSVYTRMSGSGTTKSLTPTEMTMRFGTKEITCSSVGTPQLCTMTVQENKYSLPVTDNGELYCAEAVSTIDESKIQDTRHSIVATETSDQVKMAYNTTTKKFLLYVHGELGYHTKWDAYGTIAASAEYGTETSQGVTPLAGKSYCIYYADDDCPIVDGQALLDAE